MSQSISRVGDLGQGDECADPRNSHRDYTTTYITGAATVYINNQAATTLNTLGDQSCGDGHTSTAVTGSATVFIENLAVHRIGDIGEGQIGDVYTSVTGSPDVFAG
jgi:uncharacterized Zn-binding protein involved in type VI secretion